MNSNASMMVAAQAESAVVFLQQLPATKTRLLPPPTGKSVEAHLSNTERAATMTVVLEKILTRTEYPHGGINE